MFVLRGRPWFRAFLAVLLIGAGTLSAWAQNATTANLAAPLVFARAESSGKSVDAILGQNGSPISVSGTQITGAAGAVPAGGHYVQIRSGGNVAASGYPAADGSFALPLSAPLANGTRVKVHWLPVASEVTENQIGGGYHFYLALAGGAVWAWGDNGSGQLGDGTTTARSVPGKVRNADGTGYLTDIVAVAAGRYHSLALKSDGTVWAWGRNVEGQLGDGTTSERRLPVRVAGLTDVIAISAGEVSSAALRSDGTVWTWGGNAGGKLGDGTATNRNTPVQVKGPGGTGNLTQVVSIQVGGQHMVALRRDGTVWAWGRNGVGQLGDGTFSDSLTPVQVKGAGGVGSLTDVRALAAGYSHTLALRGNGTVWAWGDNGFGQLGIGSTTGGNTTPVQVKGPGGSGNLTGVTRIAAGLNSSMAVGANGSLWAWGANYYGKLGDGTTTNQSAPVQVRGPGGLGYLAGVTGVAGGIYSTLARLSDGSLWAWGSGTSGQLGNGTGSNSSYPVQVAMP